MDKPLIDQITQEDVYEKEEADNFFDRCFSKLPSDLKLRESKQFFLNVIEREKIQIVLHVFFLSPLQGAVLLLFDGYLLQHA